MTAGQVCYLLSNDRKWRERSRPHTGCVLLSRYESIPRLSGTQNPVAKFCGEKNMIFWNCFIIMTFINNTGGKPHIVAGNLASLRDSVVACKSKHFAKATVVSLYFKVTEHSDIWPKVWSFDSAMNLRKFSILSIVTNLFLSRSTWSHAYP